MNVLMERVLGFNKLLNAWLSHRLFFLLVIDVPACLSHLIEELLGAGCLGSCGNNCLLLTCVHVCCCSPLNEMSDVLRSVAGGVGDVIWFSLVALSRSILMQLMEILGLERRRAFS